MPREMRDYANFTKIGGREGSNPGGIYEHVNTGEKWYIKSPNTRRQGVNEVMASRFYREMGFDALQYFFFDNGMVGSKWRPGLPNSSTCERLRNNDVALQTMLPSALIANWDVVGLVYDNMLLDRSMSEPVLLDFGGSFDTRAMGGSKPFEESQILAFDGFTDGSINQSAACVYGAMDKENFRKSKERVARIGGKIPNIASGMMENESEEEIRSRKLQRRWDIILDTDYEDLFGG